MESESEPRLFEYGNHWLVRRADRASLYIYWCRPGTRRVRRKSTGTADLEEAKRRLVTFVEERRAALAQPKNTLPQQPVLSVVSARTSRADPGGQPTLLDCLCDRHERVGGQQPSAVANARALALWSTFFEREDIVYPHELSVIQQEQYVAWRRRTRTQQGGTLSNATLNRELAVLRVALRDAWRRGKLSGIIHVISLTNPPPRDRFLTVEEAQRLLAACVSPHLYRFVLLALHTLQRPSAILGLRVEQVDLARNRINFLPPGATQSHKRKPVVPITATLRPELAAAISESRSGYIIEYEGSPVQRMKRGFADAAARAGLTGTTPYTLRHTGATLLAAAGVSLRQIAGMLGHTTERTTEIYAKHRPEFLSDAANTLDQLFAGSVRNVRTRSVPTVRAHSVTTTPAITREAISPIVPTLPEDVETPAPFTPSVDHCQAMMSVAQCRGGLMGAQTLTLTVKDTSVRLWEPELTPPPPSLPPGTQDEQSDVTAAAIELRERP